jgi:hypothetical protein
LKPHTIVVYGSIWLFISSVVSFMKLDTPKFSVYIFTIIILHFTNMLWPSLILTHFDLISTSQELLVLLIAFGFHLPSIPFFDFQSVYIFERKV